METTQDTPNLYDKVIHLNRQLAGHFTTHWQAWVIGMMISALLPAFISIRINITPSVPYKLFLVVKGMEAHKGDYVDVEIHTKFFPKNPYFVKVMKGVEGDVVTSRGRELFVNNNSVGIAKEKSMKGIPLEMTTPKIIGQGEFYAYAPHKDSLDSRYTDVGYLKTSQIIGRAFPLF